MYPCKSVAKLLPLIQFVIDIESASAYSALPRRLTALYLAMQFFKQLYLSAFCCLALTIAPLYSQSPWLPLPSPVTHNLRALSFVSNDSGWVAGDSGTVLLTTDGGNSWLLQDPGVTHDIGDIVFLDRRHGWALAQDVSFGDKGTYGTYILRTADGGESWDSLFIALELLHAITFLDTLNGWAGGEFGTILNSTDGGASWNRAAVDSTIFSFHPVRNIRFFSPDLGIAIGGRYDQVGAIWRLGGEGMPWQASGIGPEPLNDIFFRDSLNFLAVGGDLDYGASLVRSFDGGLSWSYQLLGIFGEATALSFRTPSEGWATLSFAGTYMVTGNGGISWNDAPTPGQVPVYDITFTDTATGYMVGNGGAIFKYNPAVLGMRADEPGAAPGFELYPNYPNPFNPGTVISYQLSVVSKIVLEVFDLAGRKVVTLVEGEQRPGFHQVRWEGQGNTGQAVSSGVYFYRLSAVSAAGSRSRSGKMVLLK